MQIKNNIPESQHKLQESNFFQRDNRASPLTKCYGWGVHADQKGKVALYACGTAEYKNLARNKTLKVLKAMRSNR